MTKKNPHWGTTVDKFLDSEGIRKTAKAEARARIAALMPNEATIAALREARTGKLPRFKSAKDLLRELNKRS